LWAPTIFLLPSIDTWQLIINTITTIITFLMVALLQNSQARSDQAIQHKLSTLAVVSPISWRFSTPVAAMRDLDRDLPESPRRRRPRRVASTSHNRNTATRPST
jgi:low affinity Fe/Cu permease